jgi:hypothetical protein
MKLQCLIKSRYPGAYNREVDFGELGIAKIVEGIADVGEELAAYMVASGNFVRIDEFEEPLAPVKAARKVRVAKVVEEVQ